MKIAEVSKRIGVPASTIRYYEKIGLVEPQRRVSGQRVFDSQALFTLEFVRLAQGAGFSIEETKSLLATYADDPSAAGAWAEMVTSKRRDIQKKMAELSQMDGVLIEMLSCNCDSLTDCVEKGMARRKSENRTPMIEWLGIIAITVMVVAYALEKRDPIYVAIFAAGCVMASVYAYLIGSYPFLVAEGLWALIAGRRWLETRRRA